MTMPHSALAWVCLVVGLLILLPSPRRCAERIIVHSSRSKFVLVLWCGTFLSSLAYVHFYLKGGPRIIDATSYWLQAHVFAQGDLAFEVPGPVHSFAGRFLVVTPSGRLAVLFPPGFAAVLAIGVKLGLPLVVNPILGATCAVLTYHLGRSWWSEPVGRVSGTLSALCATLRYHSADTMSHVLCACLVLGLLLAVGARPHRDNDAWCLPLVGGLCAGWLFATRPVTGIVFGVAGLAAGLYVRPRSLGRTARSVAFYALGAVPGLCLWFVYQWATTGSLWSSTQSVYYSRSDYPQDCFGLGFGAHIGCQFEHGDFLADYQPHGYGWREALAVCGRRLWLHMRDVANLPWAPLLGLVTLRRVSTERPVAAVWALLTVHVVAYAAFYYDGNYPGGGARLLAEVIPLQHLLLAAALASLSATWAAIPMTALGFALWSSQQHTALSEREGGRPMFEASTLEHFGVKRGLVFTNTDHGFNLGHTPDTDPADSPLVVRARGDALDYSTWVALQRPEAFRHTFDPYRRGSTPSLERFTPEPSGTFLGSSFWPPLDTHHGSATPHHSSRCGGPGLSLHPETPLTPQQTLVQLWVSIAGDYELEVAADGPMDVVGWPSLGVALDAGGCRVARYAARALEAGALSLTLANVMPATVSRLTLRPVSNPTGLGGN